MKTYSVNEIFYAPQGEGVRAGTMNVFIRFAGCNLTCRQESHGFDCDTEFSNGRKLTAEQIVQEAQAAGGVCGWVVLTGGEPALQVDVALLTQLQAAGYQIAIETNGSIELQKDCNKPEDHTSGRPCYGKFDWITVSPKVAEHAIRQCYADEVKYVRHVGQAVPKTAVHALHYVLSPGWDGDGLSKENLQWTMQLCRENPQWRLSVQLHKLWRSR